MFLPLVQRSTFALRAIRIGSEHTKCDKKQELTLLVQVQHGLGEEKGLLCLHCVLAGKSRESCHRSFAQFIAYTLISVRGIVLQ